jgi:hypothetical protein
LRMAPSSVVGLKSERETARRRRHSDIMPAARYFLEAGNMRRFTLEMPDMLLSIGMTTRA